MSRLAFADSFIRLHACYIRRNFESTSTCILHFETFDYVFFIEI